MNLLFKILNDCFTGSDNKTFSLIRISFGAVLIVFIALSIWDCHLDHDFKMLEFGGGISAIIAAFGGAMWLSKDSQPGNNHARTIKK